MEKNQYREEPLKDNVEEMFIGPFGSSLKNECFVDERNAYCMVYEQKHAIQKTLAGKNRFVDRNKYQELKRFTVKPGDIIVSCRGTIGETFIIPENAPLGIMHPSIMKIRLKPNVYNIEYFNLLLKSRLEAHNKSANGSGVKMAISATELGKDLFPIPPMDEQQKISRIFFMVEHLMLLRKQQLAKMDELVKARFVEMFENVTEENALENLCHFIDYRGKTPEKSDSGLPFITAKNIRMHYMSFDTQEFISKENYDKVMTRGIPKVGDVVFTTEAPLGNVCRIPQFDTDFYIGQRIITMQTKLLNPVYLEYALSSDDFKRKLVGKSSGSTVTGIRSKLLGKLTIPVPSKGLQNQFAAFVERADQQKQTVQQSLEKLELMKKALMQEYFG